jgi:hypothetical protein
MITPESLKKVAEYMGYRPRTNISGNIVEIAGGGIWIRPKNNRINTYNPLQNSDQDSEIEVKFKIATTRASSGTWLAYIGTDDSGLGFPEVSGSGKTPKEARLNAAIAYVEGLDNG